MLTITDETTGESRYYETNADGYQEAYEFIEEIEDQGHQATGDIPKIRDTVETTPWLHSTLGIFIVP